MEDMKLIHVLAEDDKELLALVCLDYVFNYVLGVLKISFHQLTCLLLVFNLRRQFHVQHFLHLVKPEVVLVPVSVDTRPKKFCSNQEVLMDIVQQILQISIHTRFCINSFHVASKQVIKLYDTYRYGFKLLRLNHLVSELHVLQKLSKHHLVQIC